jgi:hypothetical protein
MDCIVQKNHWRIFMFDCPADYGASEMYIANKRKMLL